MPYPGDIAHTGWVGTATVSVLVVDDDDALGRFLALALSVVDGVAEVKVCRSARAAVSLCQSFTPDLIVLDYWMPYIDGETCALLLRGLCPDALIVSYSGVLEDKPHWSDVHVLKGDVPDLEALVAQALG